MNEDQEIGVMDLVEKLCSFDPTQTKGKLISVVRALDEDGSGSISLDEFLNHFGAADDDDDEFTQAQEEQMLQDEMWPRWVLDEGALPRA